MKRVVVFTVAALLVLGLPLAATASEEKTRKMSPADKRAKIDAMAKDALDRLFEQVPQAMKLFDEAYGYAAFSNMKFALGLSGGGGSGVAVDKGSGDRTYMKMGTAGVGVGLGGRKYNVVLLFENQKAFENFVTKGWQADTSATATAGTDGVDAASTFSDGLALYAMSDKGLMAHAEVAGTKYWKNDKLN